jgi:two-component system, cell cycle response regulator DivK
MSYVLLVEDNPQHAEMANHILTSAGYEVKTVARGLEAAALARRNPPLIILMDFDLPDVDGKVLTLSLRNQLGGKKAPPFVAVTAHASSMNIALAQRFGCAAFVAKPYTADRLLTVVNGLVNRDPKTSTSTGEVRVIKTTLPTD